MPTELDELRREIQEIRQRQREMEQRTPAPTPAPPAPVQERDIVDELDRVIEQHVAQPGQPREREGRGPRKPELVPPEPPREWWLDPREEQAIIRAAAQIRDREAPERALRADLRVPAPPSRLAQFEEPSPPALTPQGLPEILTEVGRRERRGEAYPGVPPPGFETVQQPRTPLEALQSYVQQARRRWGGVPAEEIPPVVTPEYEGRGFRVPSILHPGEEVYFDPGAALQQVKKIPGGGGIVSAVEFTAHALLTGLSQLDFIPERGIGALMFRNLKPPDEARAAWESGEVEIAHWIRASSPELYDEMMEESLSKHTQLYQALYEDPELSEKEQAWLVNDYLPRIAWSGVDSWLDAIPRLKAGENPDEVLAEEADPIRELVGNVIVSLDWPLGKAVSFWKETRLVKKLTAFWTAPVEALPHWLTGAARARKGLIERLVPWELTRGAKSNALTNVVGSAISNAVRVYGDDVDGIRSVLRGIDDEEGLKLFMEGIRAHPESEGAKAFKMVSAEEGFVDKLVGLLEGRVSARQLSELGEEAKDVRVFVPSEFLDEVETLTRTTADDLFSVDLDRPWKYNIPAKLGNALKSHLSDFWLGLNPGYAWRNAYNNFATLTIDNLIDGYSFQPKKRTEFLDLWFGEGVRPGAMLPGLGATPAAPARTARGELVGAGGRGSLPIHKVAAWTENYCREIGWVTALRRWKGKMWENIGPMFPRTLRNYLPIDPDLEGRIYAAVSGSLRYEDDVDAVKKVLRAVGGPEDLLPEEARLAGNVRQWIPEDAEVRDSTVGFLQGFYDDLAADGDVERFRIRASALIDDLRTEYMVGRGRDGFVANTKHGAWQMVDNPGLTPYAEDLPTPYHVFPGHLKRIEEGPLGWGFEQKRAAQLDVLEELRGIPRHEIQSPEGTLPMTIMREDEKWAYAKRLFEEAKGAGYKLSDEEQAFLAQEKYVPMYRSPALVPEGPLSAPQLDEKVLEFRRLINERKVQLLKDSGIDNTWLQKNLKLETPEAAEQVGERLYQWGVVNAAWDPKGYRNVLSHRLPDEIDYTTLLRERSRITDLKNSSGGTPDPSSVGLGEWFRDQLDFFEGKRDTMPVLRDYVSPLEADEIARPEYMEQLISDRGAVEALNGQLVDGLVERVRRGQIGPDQLRAAVADGVLSEEQAEALLRLGQGAGRDFMGIGRPAPFGIYHSDILESTIESEIRLIRRTMDEGPPNVTLPPELFGKGGDSLLPPIESWLKQDVAQARAAFKMTGEMYAKELTDFALLDYGRRHNLDLWMAMFMPYPYWRTYTGVNWLQRTATKPWAFNAYRGLRDATRKMREEMPTRLKDAGIDVEAPWLADWLGEWTGKKLMMDPVRLLFAPVETWPLSTVWETQWDDPAEAENELQLFTSFTDAMQMRFYPWIDWGVKLLSGEGLEKEYYLFPQTSFLKGVTAMLWEKNIGREGPELDASWLPESLRSALGWGETVELSIPPGGISLEAFPRRAVRNALDMSEYELPSSYYYEEFYWPVAHLVFMLESGEIDKETYEEVKYDRLYKGNKDNPIWQKAYNRAAVQKAVPAITGFMLGQRWKMYPAAEERIRAEQEEWRSLLWSPEQPYGGAEAGRAYREAHPELAARSELFAMMGPSVRFYKNADGTYDMEGYRTDMAEWEQAGAMPGMAGRQYKLYQYFKGNQALDEMEGELHNELLKEGFIPGTKAFRIADRYLGELKSAHYDQYRQLWVDYEANPPFGASPGEYLDWVEEQEARYLSDAYYDIKAEDYADAEGNIDFDAWEAAQDAAWEQLPLSARQYINRNLIPEEEAMTAIEKAVYSPISDLIWQVGQAEGDEREKLQERLNALKDSAPEDAENALLDAMPEIVELHPDWGADEEHRLLQFEIPTFDTWQRSFDTPREALEQTLRNFYWGLDSGTRKTLWDQKWATKAGVPDNYLGKDFESFREEDYNLKDLDDVSDEQLLQWLAHTGQLLTLEEEGFPIPGRDLPSVLRQVPGYAGRVAGEGEGYEFVVTGRAGSTLAGVPGSERLPTAPKLPGEERAGEPPSSEAERIEARMRDAVARLAVQGEEDSEVELLDPSFQMPTQENVDEWSQLQKEQDAYWAAEEQEDGSGEWTPLMEKWLSDPNSPKSLWWKAYGDWRAPEENNPLGWGLLPRELKDDPFISMIFDAMESERELADDVYLEARASLDDYVAQHGEELLQAKQEYIEYIAQLDPELEELQDKYYEFPQGSQERRDFIGAHPELGDYWDMKRTYKDEHPVMVKHYFPPQEDGTGYQPRTYFASGGGWRGGRRARRGTSGAPSGRTNIWGEFKQAAGPEMVEVLIAYWTGRQDLTPASRSYLEALFKANKYGAGSFKQWLELLRRSWEGSLAGAGGTYIPPMRSRGTVVSEAQRRETSYTPRPPTRIRYLRG